MSGLGHREESPYKPSSSRASSVTRLPPDSFHGALSTRSTSDLGSTVITDYLHDGAYMDTSFNGSEQVLMQGHYPDTSSHHGTHMFEQQGGGEGDAIECWGSGDEDSVKGFNDEDDVERPYRDMRSQWSGLLTERWGSGDEDSVKGFNDEDDVERQYRDMRSRSSGLLRERWGSGDEDSVKGFNDDDVERQYRDMRSRSSGLLRERWGSGDEDSVKGFNDDDVERPYRDMRSRSSGLLIPQSEFRGHYRWRHSKESDMFRSQTIDVTGDEMASGTEEPMWLPAPHHITTKRARSSQGYVPSHHVMYGRQRSMDSRLMNSSHNVYQGMESYYHHPPFHHSYMKGAKSYSGIDVPRKASSVISEPYCPPRGYRRNGRHSAMSGYSHSHHYPGHPGYADGYSWYQDTCTQSTHPDSLSQPSMSPMDEFPLDQPPYGPKLHSPGFMSSSSSISVPSPQISRQPSMSPMDEFSLDQPRYGPKLHSPGFMSSSSSISVPSTQISRQAHPHGHV